MEDAATNKRVRDDSDESPEAKRIRADMLIDILDDDDDDVESGDRDPEAQDLASVMRIFEEEIALLSADPPAEAVADPDPDDSRQPDLGYLLEASDDELGLPPTVPPEEEEGSPAEVIGCVEEASGFGKIWGFDEEISECYDGLDFGFRPEEGGEERVDLEEGLFDYPDAPCGPFDFPDLPWRPESLPAV